MYYTSKMAPKAPKNIMVYFASRTGWAISGATLNIESNADNGAIWVVYFELFEVGDDFEI